MCLLLFFFFFFFFNDTATTEIYTLSLHDALPISAAPAASSRSSADADRAGMSGRAGIATGRARRSGCGWMSATCASCTSWRASARYSWRCAIGRVALAVPLASSVNRSASGRSYLTASVDLTTRPSGVEIGRAIRASVNGTLAVRPARARSIRSPLWMSTAPLDRKSTRLNSSHVEISYAVFCLKEKNYKRALRRERGVSLRDAVHVLLVVGQVLDLGRDPGHDVYRVDARLFFFY